MGDAEGEGLGDGVAVGLAVGDGEGVGIGSTVKAALVKTDRRRYAPEEELDHAIRQVCRVAITPGGVIDVFEAAGLKKPDISLLSEEFLAEVREMLQWNLAVELLQRLINGNPGQPEIVRIDPSSGQAVATIPLDGGYGRSIFAIEGSVLAAIVQPPGGPYDGGTLVRIDPSTNHVAGTLDLGAYPSVATGDGTMWAVTGSGLVQIDPGTGQPTGAPASVPCTGDALAAGASGVWCFDPARDRALTGFNPQTAQVDVAMRPDEGTGGTALTTSPGSICVVSGERLTRVDLELEAVG